MPPGNAHSSRPVGGRDGPGVFVRDLPLNPANHLSFKLSVQEDAVVDPIKERGRTRDLDLVERRGVQDEKSESYEALRARRR